jgi:hypothetical protein
MMESIHTAKKKVKTKHTYLPIFSCLLALLFSVHAFCESPEFVATQLTAGAHYEKRIDLRKCSLPPDYVYTPTHDTEPQSIRSQYQFDQFGHLWGAIVIKGNGLLSRSEKAGEVFLIRIDLGTGFCERVWHRGTTLDSNVALLLTPSGCVLVLSDNVLTRVSTAGSSTAALMLPTPKISQGVAYRILQSPDRTRLVVLTERGEMVHSVVVNPETLGVLKQCNQIIHNWNEPTLINTGAVAREEPDPDSHLFSIVGYQPCAVSSSKLAVAATAPVRTISLGSDLAVINSGIHTFDRTGKSLTSVIGRPDQEVNTFMRPVASADGTRLAVWVWTGEKSSMTGHRKITGQKVIVYDTRMWTQLWEHEVARRSWDGTVVELSPDGKLVARIDGDAIYVTSFGQAH